MLVKDLDSHYEKEKETTIPNDISWDKCFICQKDSKEKLVSPVRAINESSDDYDSQLEEKYAKFINDIKRFADMDILDTDLKQRLRIDGVADVCKENSAVYHKTCRNKFDNHHFERENKKRKLNKDEAKADDVLPKTRSRLSAQNFQKQCFLCNTVTSEPLHQVQTINVDKRVRSAAEVLVDQELLAKLSEGDLVATEASYHNACLTKLTGSAQFIQQKQNYKNKIKF